MRSLFILALMLMMTACGPGTRGTDEAGQFPTQDGPPLNSVEVVTYDFLNSKVLQPGRCTNCHSEMETERGLAAFFVAGEPEQSQLFRRVSSRSMPPSRLGIIFSDDQIETVRRYIIDQAIEP